MSLRTRVACAFSVAMATSSAFAQPVADELRLTIEPGTIVLESSQESGKTATDVKAERSILDVRAARVDAIEVSPMAEQIKIRAVRIGHEKNSSEINFESHDAGSAELIRQRFPNGKPQIERWVAEDADGNLVNHGKYVEFDEKGATVTAGSYVYGKQDGEWTKRLSLEEAQQLAKKLDKSFAAPFSSRATFKAGKLDGDWTLSDARGNLLFAWTYRDGVREGQSAEFNSKGEVVVSINYKNNLADGPAKIEVSGAPAQFTQGLMVRQADQWYPAEHGKNRTLKSQESQLVPVPFNIASSNWNENKIEYQPTTSTQPVKHGLSVMFYSNGQRESEGNYDHGRRSGTFAWWYPNGQQKTVGEYRNDVEESNWTWWHENGMKQASGLFVEGKKKDEWSLWNEQGKLVSRTHADDVKNVAQKPSTESTIQNR